MFRDKPCFLQLSESKMVNQAEKIVPSIIIDSFLSYPGVSYLDGIGLSGMKNSSNKAYTKLMH